MNRIKRMWREAKERFMEGGFTNEENTEIMETKMIKVPFDVEMAKKITDGEVPGKIVTRDGRSARIICWDKKGIDLPIVALVDQGDEQEDFETYMSDGRWCDDEIDALDLMLEVPEYMTFKDGDVLTSCGCPFIFKGYKDDGCMFYAGVNATNNLVISNGSLLWTIDSSDCTPSTETEKQKLIDALKASKDPRAKECLKKLGIEVKKEYQFKPFDKVLVRDYNDEKWKPAFFWCKTKIFRTIGCNDWNQCIPFEGNEHLLGTTKSHA